MESMAKLLEPYPTMTLYDTPMAADALSRFRETACARNPLMLHKVSEAQSILRLGLYITRGVRAELLPRLGDVQLHRNSPDCRRMGGSPPVASLPGPNTVHGPDTPCAT